MDKVWDELRFTYKNEANYLSSMCSLKSVVLYRSVRCKTQYKALYDRQWDIGHLMSKKYGEELCLLNYSLVSESMYMDYFSKISKII